MSTLKNSPAKKTVRAARAVENRLLHAAGFGIATLMGVISASSSIQASTITSTFDSGVESWQGGGDELTFAFVAVGGNPGGYIATQPAYNIASLDAVASSLYHGNLTAFSGGSIGFDGVVFNPSGTDFRSAYGIVSISDGITTLTQDLSAIVPVSGWTHFEGSFAASAFGTSEASWSTLLGNVTDLRISLNGYDSAIGSRSFGFDNFHVASVPEPASLSVLALGGLALLARRRK